MSIPHVDGRPNPQGQNKKQSKDKAKNHSDPPSLEKKPRDIFVDPVKPDSLQEKLGYGQDPRLIRARLIALNEEQKRK